ncbi:helix-turn-helix transcriptional regulator [Actinophytocola sp.]|uniref:helix-turn-helix domain-containing protein n=1 Tax=Actinophytocola sp. TaxID=1872138 RepID=UPI002ED02446
MGNDNRASVRQRRVSAELRALRQAKGLTCQQVADALDWSVSKVSRMETGVRGLYPDDVAAMLGYLETPSKLRDELLTLVRDGEKPNWIQIGSGLPKHWKILLRMESDATAIYNYEPLVVPGLLQTDEYARAIISTGNRDLGEGVVDHFVRTRMGRRAMLSRPDGPMLSVMVDEMVLRRAVGGSDCMRGQLQHLLNMANRPRVEILVVPFGVGENPGLEGPMMIMEFDTQPTLVFVEVRSASGFLEEPTELRRARIAWRELRSMALSPEDSVRFIADLAGELT